MRKLFISIAAVWSIFLFNGCEKPLDDVNDYFPEVKTVSATVNSDGTVEVRGEIISDGHSPVEYAGFCMDTSPAPGMLKNQVIGTISGKYFTAVYSGMNLNTRYYFRSWASNDDGYSLGNTLYLDSIEATPVVAPCTITMNYLDPGTIPGPGSIYSVSGANLVTTYWRIEVNSNTTTAYFEFATKPHTGIYTTSSSGLSNNNVRIYFYSGFVSGTLNSGSPVYVNETSPDVYEITVCSSPWDYSSSSVGYFKARFQSPL